MRTGNRPTRTLSATASKAIVFAKQRSTVPSFPRPLVMGPVGRMVRSSATFPDEASHARAARAFEQTLLHFSNGYNRYLRAPGSRDKLDQALASYYAMVAGVESIQKERLRADSPHQEILENLVTYAVSGQPKDGELTQSFDKIVEEGISGRATLNRELSRLRKSADDFKKPLTSEDIAVYNDPDGTSTYRLKADRGSYADGIKLIQRVLDSHGPHIRLTLAMGQGTWGADRTSQMMGMLDALIRAEGVTPSIVDPETSTPLSPGRLSVGVQERMSVLQMMEIVEDSISDSTPAERAMVTAIALCHVRRDGKLFSRQLGRPQKGDRLAEVFLRNTSAATLAELSVMAPEPARADDEGAALAGGTGTAAEAGSSTTPLPLPAKIREALNKVLLSDGEAMDATFQQELDADMAAIQEAAKRPGCTLRPAGADDSATASLKGAGVKLVLDRSEDPPSLTTSERTGVLRWLSRGEAPGSSTPLLGGLIKKLKKVPRSMLTTQPSRAASDALRVEAAIEGAQTTSSEHDFAQHVKTIVGNLYTYDSSRASEKIRGLSLDELEGDSNAAFKQALMGKNLERFLSREDQGSDDKASKISDLRARLSTAIDRVIATAKAGAPAQTDDANPGPVRRNIVFRTLDAMRRRVPGPGDGGEGRGDDDAASTGTRSPSPRTP